MKLIGYLLFVVGILGAIIVPALIDQVEMGLLDITGAFRLSALFFFILLVSIGWYILFTRKLRTSDLTEGKTYLVVQSGPTGGDTRFLYLAPVDIGAGKAVRQTFKTENISAGIEYNNIVRAKGRGLVLVAKVSFIPELDKVK
ncbi:hypothetical protein KJ562_01230 [Patescibacteria group bacterium]|nr:hypothetical protein [Patescibacteria group bacterium]MBU4162400.1 hypothetical protein [Patescibacteria group bacterium]